MTSHKKTKVLELLRSIVGSKVKYRRCGGGAGSIILQNYADPLECSLWVWSHWEIEEYECIIATSEDDDTPVTGLMATAAKSLENSTVIGFSLYENFALVLYFSNNRELYIYLEEREEEFKNLVIWELLSFKRHYRYFVDLDFQLQEEYFER